MTEEKETIEMEETLRKFADSLERVADYGTDLCERIAAERGLILPSREQLQEEWSKILYPSNEMEKKESNEK